MLRLNPDDNQGIRHILAYLFAEADRDDAFEGLLESTAKILWRRSVRKGSLAVPEERAGPEADEALEEAMEGNPFVPQYLLGRRKPPTQVPDYHGLGDRSEAIAYVTSAQRMVVTEGALAWLKSRYQAWLDQ